ncbi:MAG: hypothetical protein ACLSBH_20420 [Coprobacillus cateniformis]
MSDDEKTKQWVHYYESIGYQAMSVNLKNFNEYQKIIEKCRKVLKPKMDKEKARGIKPRAIRAMVLEYLMLVNLLLLINWLIVRRL